MASIDKVIKIFTDELKDIYPVIEIRSIAELVLEYYLGYSKTELFLNRGEVLSQRKYTDVVRALERLKANEPVQYILGETEFFGLKFKVAQGVLIPRPETEELVDWVLSDHRNQSELTILDIGTGSGCIAISLAVNVVNSRVCAFDVSKDALKISKENAQLNNVNVNFLEKNILKNQGIVEREKFDIIISNPPYVLINEKEKMRKNVLDYEPELALFVENEEPLLFYDAIVNYSKLNLRPGGSLYFEINEAFGQEVFSLMKKKGFVNIEVRKDLNGKERMVRGSLN